MEEQIPTVFDDPKWLEQVTANNVPLGESWVRRSPHFYKIVKGDHLLRTHFTGEGPARVQWNLRLVESTFTGSGNIGSLPEVQQTFLDLLKLGRLFKDNLSNSLKSFIRQCPTLQYLHDVEDIKSISLEDLFHVWAELSDAILCDGDIVDRLKLPVENLRDDAILIDKKRFFYYFGWDLAFAVINTGNANNFVPTAPILIAVSGDHFLEIYSKLRRKTAKAIFDLVQTMREFTVAHGNPIIHRTRGLARKVLANTGELEDSEAPTSSKNLNNSRRSTSTAASASKYSPPPIQQNQRALRASRRSEAITPVASKLSTINMSTPRNNKPKKGNKRTPKANTAASDTLTSPANKYMRLDYCSPDERDKIRSQRAEQRAARFAARNGETSTRAVNDSHRDEMMSVEMQDEKQHAGYLLDLKTNFESDQVHTSRPATSPPVPNGVELDEAVMQDQAEHIEHPSTTMQSSEGSKDAAPVNNSQKDENMEEDAQQFGESSERVTAENHQFPRLLGDLSSTLPQTHFRRQRTRSIGNPAAPSNGCNFMQVHEGHPAYNNVVGDTQKRIASCIKVYFDSRKKSIKVTPFIPEFVPPSNWGNLDKDVIRAYATTWADFIKPNLPTDLLVENRIDLTNHKCSDDNVDGKGVTFICPQNGPYSFKFTSVRRDAKLSSNQKDMALGDIDWHFVRSLEEWMNISPPGNDSQMNEDMEADGEQSGESSGSGTPTNNGHLPSPEPVVPLGSLPPSLPQTHFRRLRTRSTGNPRVDSNFVQVHEGDSIYDDVVRVTNKLSSSVNIFFDSRKKSIKISPFIPEFRRPMSLSELNSDNIAPYATVWADFIKPNLPVNVLFAHLIVPVKHEYYDDNSDGCGITVVCRQGESYTATFNSIKRDAVYPLAKKVFELGDIDWLFVQKIEEYLQTTVYSSSYVVTDCTQKNPPEARNAVHFRKAASDRLSLPSCLTINAQIRLPERLP